MSVAKGVVDLTDLLPILAIDQGTTSSRAIRFDLNQQSQRLSQQKITQYYPQPGWVEHDPEEIWRTTLEVARDALSNDPVAALGIANQRETTLIWDRKTGEPIHPAIVWQDRRTAAICSELKSAGAESLIKERTGLLLDPYFSGTKVSWLLDHVDGARGKADRGELAFGTVDSFLIWRLTAGRRHVTDATNASRTLMFNIHDQTWDDDVLQLLKIPRTILPEVLDCADDFGETDATVFGRAIPIRGVAGDQHAAMVGQACFENNSVKSTFGTGCFMLSNTGERIVNSENGLITTLAYRLGGVPTYALEGSIFVAGSAVQWLRDELSLIKDARETEAIAADLDTKGGNNGVYLIPAFVGLGAPHWQPNARGALFGLTRGTNSTHLVRAALEAVSYQAQDLTSAMAADSGSAMGVLRVDGGMAENNWLMQFLADILEVSVERPLVTETTALGAAQLAALGVGEVRSVDELSERWYLDRRFVPRMSIAQRAKLIEGWQAAVAGVLASEPE